MADTQDTTVTPAAPTTASIPDATITANPTPQSPASPAAEPVIAPVTEATNATQTPATPEPAAAATSATGSPEPVVEAPVESVLGEKPKEVVKTETKAEGEKPTAEVKVETPAEVKVELPVYEAFKLPENVTLDKEPLDAFTKILGEIETGKLDHKGMQEKGQALIDLAAKSTAESINRLNDSYVEIHNKAKKERFESLKADPELGGEKLQDTISALQKSVSEYGGTEAQIAAFRKEVSEAGIDASPALCRLIYNMQQKIDKYTTEPQNTMVPGSKPAPSKVKDYQRFYTGGN